MNYQTTVTRAGLPAPVQGMPFLPGPSFAAPYHAAGDPSASPFTYGRNHNPTWGHWEEALSELEGGPTVAFASGMAAVTAIFGSVLRPGDVAVLPSDSYYMTRALATSYFTDMGVQVRLAPTEGNGQGKHLEKARLLWIETPSNPELEVCDIAELVRTAHKEGALVAVDNTTATVLGQQPLALGADFSIASDTKALTGHSDLILGHVAARDESWAERIRAWRTQTGSIPGPMEVWLAHRSLASLGLRLDRQCANALRIAEFLRSRSEVAGVRYPGLPEDPSHELASSQMRYFGSMVGFVLEDKEHAIKFLDACNLVYEATSFGGIHSSAERRARWGSDAVPDAFIRLSVGCEHVDDLLEDISQALTTAAASGA